MGTGGLMGWGRWGMTVWVPPRVPGRWVQVLWEVQVQEPQVLVPVQVVGAGDAVM